MLFFITSLAFPSQNLMYAVFVIKAIVNNMSFWACCLVQLSGDLGSFTFNSFTRCFHLLNDTLIVYTVQMDRDRS